jgi:hypothetical protein
MSDIKAAEWIQGDNNKHARQTVGGYHGSDSEVSCRWLAQWRGNTVVEMNRHDLETTHWEFKMQVAAVKAQNRHGSGGNAGTGAVVVKLWCLVDSYLWQYFTKSLWLSLNKIVGKPGKTGCLVSLWSASGFEAHWATSGQTNSNIMVTSTWLWLFFSDRLMKLSVEES